MPQQLFELLKKDHRLAEQLMDKLVEGDEDQRHEFFSQLNASLVQHMQLEEKYFYPRIKSAQQMKDLVADALREHRETKEFLQKLNKMRVETEEWIDTLQEMQEGVLHHVEDEEDKIFPKCKDVLDAAQLREIAGQILQEKEHGAPQKTAARKPAGKPAGKPARP